MPINSESLERRVCPHCGVESIPVPVVYGYPSSEMFEAYERGEIRLGGCVVEDESPEFECPSCHAALPWVAKGGRRVEGLASVRFGR